MKKIFGMIIALILIAGSGVGVYYVIKESNINLDISIEDIEVFEEESQVVKYSCNIDEAELLFNVKDDAIAKVEKKDLDYVVTGLSAGTTKLTMTAKYNKYKNFSEATIIVKEKQPSVPINSEIEYELHGTSNFEIVGDTITMEAGTPSIFSVVSSEGDIHSVEVISNDSQHVVVTPKTTNKIFKIECSDAGTYLLIVRVNGHSKTFTLLVNPQQDSSEEDPPEDQPEDPLVTQDYSVLLNSEEITGRTLTISAGVNASLQLVRGSEEIFSSSVTTENTYVSINKKFTPANTYTIRCESTGTYTINIVVNDVSTTYTLIVE